MKRYASHFLFLPGHGFLERYVVEMEAGVVVRLFPLAEEIESTEWLPGVIALLPPEEILSGEASPEQERDRLLFDGCRHILNTLPAGMEEELPNRVPYLYYPFDFTTMQPVAGTRRKRLQ